MEETSFRIKKHSLFWLILASHVNLEHKTPINSSRDQSRLLLVKISEMDKPDLKRQPTNQNQMFIKNMKLEISRNSKIKLMSSWVNYRWYRMTWCFVEEVDVHYLLSVGGLPNMQLLFIVRDKRPNVLVVENVLNLTSSPMPCVWASKLMAKLQCFWKHGSVHLWLWPHQGLDMINFLPNPSKFADRFLFSSSSSLSQFLGLYHLRVSLVLMFTISILILRCWSVLFFHI